MPAPMLARVLEAEVMDSANEAESYDAMDHRAVNAAFAADALALAPGARRILDVGTGTGLIALVLAARTPLGTVTAVDLAGHMLARAAHNVARSGLGDRIALVRIDAKRLPYAAGDFDLVVSNSVVHHVPEPVALFAELARVAGPTAAVFVRDLVRPTDLASLEALVETHARDEAPPARELFRASLHAALTIDEVRASADRVGFTNATVALTSDRHWTLSRPLAR